MDSSVKGNKMSIIQSVEDKNIKIEVLQYDELGGSDNINISETIFFAKQSGIRLKQIRVTLNNASIVMESGALHYMKGNITTENKVGGVSGFAKKLTSNLLTKESVFRPTYTGTGEIYLEPSFGHYIIIKLENEEMVVDKGMFYCCETSIDVGVAMQKNISSAVFGGEGLFQTKLRGTGICVLATPVPIDEIRKFKLNNEKLQVDGDFALLRKGNINFSVEKSSKSILGSMTSGEGLLQTFQGTGEVWIAPTQGIYEKMISQGINSLIKVKGNSNTETK